MDTLDERKSAILRAVVQEYIETAQPVGSSRIANAAGVAVSSATVRNEMVALEEQGYLRQPHTSAGRVPTEKGYRLFVDELAGPGPLDRGRQEQVREFFRRTHGELERMLRDTSGLLARLTDSTAIVVGPEPDAARVRSVQLVSLSSHVVLVVLVLSNGAVTKCTIDVPGGVDDTLLAETGSSLDSLLRNQTLGQIGQLDRSPELGPGVGELVALALQALADESAHEARAYVEGTSRVATAFDAVDTVREVLGILEKQLVVVSLLRDVIDRGLNVAIGTETGFEPLSECSLVVAPYAVEGEGVGTIGVLGPTRMNYPQALAAVAVVGHTLGRHLSEG